MSLSTMRRAAPYVALMVGAPAFAESADDLVQPGGPPAPAQQEVVVTAPAQRGRDPRSSPVESRLTQDEIATYGAGSIGELLTSLNARTGAAPIILINGRPVSGPAAFAGLPPEAIERMDFLSPEAAIAYGYPADQRIVNIVLVEHFAAVTPSLAVRAATAGGRDEERAAINVARIQGDTRLGLDLAYGRQSALVESERRFNPADIMTRFGAPGRVSGMPPGAELDPALSQLAGTPVTFAAVPAGFTQPPVLADFLAGANRTNLADDGAARSLLPAGETLDLAATLSRPLPGGIQATLNLRFNWASNLRLLGTPGGSFLLPAASPWSPFAGDVRLDRAFTGEPPLATRNETINGALGLALAGSLGSWALTVNGELARARAVSRTAGGVDPGAFQSRIDGGANPFATFLPGDLALLPDERTVSTTRSSSAEAAAVGPLFALPAGQVAASLRLRYGDLTGTNEGTGLPGARRTTLREGGATASVTVPLLRRGQGALGSVGDVALNLTAGYRRDNVAGGAASLAAGASWAPIRGLRFSATWSRTDGQVQPAQRSAPVTETENVPVFDPTTGQSVLVTRIDGGNPALVSPRTSGLLLSGTYRPAGRSRLGFNFTYAANRVRDPVGLLPGLTPALELAFPDRFQRDASGRLVRVDARPLNFARALDRRLSWGLQFTLPLPGGLGGRAAPAGAPGAEADGQAGAEGGNAVQRGDGAPGGGGRILFSLNHVWRVANRLGLAPGLPLSDLSEGAAFGGRPAPRHQLDAQFNIFSGGVGASVQGSWQSGSQLSGGASALHFSSLLTANLRLFANLGDVAWFGRAPWLSGMTVSLDVGNVFDSRTRVRDQFGETPLAYQSAYLDPLGRTVQLTLRRRF